MRKYGSKKLLIIFVFLISILSSLSSPGQTIPGKGRITIYYTNSDTETNDGDSWNQSEIVSSFTLRGPQSEENGWEYGIHFRAATYPSTDRDTRISIYNAYFGRRMMNNQLVLCGGQLWIDELGALGSVGGVMVEWRQPREEHENRLRIGSFFGYEPEIMDFDYANNVKKFGGYIALDGDNSRRHVLGLVSIQNSGFTERSVLTTTNFIPITNRLYIYQGAEFDLEGPAGEGSGELTYFYTNARYRPSDILEFQGTYHRGRSIDARTITIDKLNGRPVNPDALEGFLFDSAGGKVWVRLPGTVRLFGGYSKSKNNRDDSNTDRVTFGVIVQNLIQSGIDIYLADTRIKRTGMTSDSWYASAGKSFGRNAYISVEYASSLSVLRFSDPDTISIEHRPRNNRYMFSGLFHLTRAFTLNVTGELFRDDSVKEIRVMTGLSYRFW